jgi:hypothetical protein
LQERFPGRDMRLGAPPSPCIAFPAIHPDVGDVEIYDDGDELTVVLGRFTHGHLSSYDDALSMEQKAARISDEAATFLEELFADRIVLWGSHEGTGGWRKRGERSTWPIDTKEYVWSGPLALANSKGK